MQLTKFHQSGFILQLDNGFRVAWDIGNKTPVRELDAIDAVDLFVVSHIHGDHYSPEHIAKLQPDKLISTQEVTAQFADASVDSVAVANGDKVETDDVLIEFFDVDHGPNVSAPVENVGFLLTVKATGEKIYFAGDMYRESGMDVSGLDVDYALLPVGSHYTFGPNEAADFAKKFASAKEVIPMHYEMNPETYEQFKQLLASQ